MQIQVYESTFHPRRLHRRKRLNKKLQKLELNLIWESAEMSAVSVPYGLLKPGRIVSFTSSPKV